MITIKKMLGFSISLIVATCGHANQVDAAGYSGTFPEFLNSRFAKWESGKPSTFTPLIEKIMNEDWNEVNSKLFNGQIVEISGDIKKSKKIQIDDQSIKTVEKLIDTYTTHVVTMELANTEAETEKLKTEELAKWADMALGQGEDGFNKTLNDLKTLVIGNGPQKTCFYNCTKSYNESIFEDIAERDKRYVCLTKKK